MNHNRIRLGMKVKLIPKLQQGREYDYVVTEMKVNKKEPKYVYKVKSPLGEFFVSAFEIDYEVRT